MIQTQKVIAQLHETNTAMKHRRKWALNSQCVGMRKWRGDFEREILKDRVGQKVFSGRVVTSHIESQSHLNHVKKELGAMKDQNRN